MKNKEKWCALYMPASESYNPTKCGFASEDDAWEFIISRSCDSCKKSDIDMCSAEWEVCTEEEWNSCKEDDI